MATVTIVSAGVEVLDRGMALRLRDIADAVAGDARALAPVDTGRLRDSITVEHAQGVSRIVAGAPYAAAVELGTSTRAAQPFLRPALLKRTRR